MKRIIVIIFVVSCVFYACRTQKHVVRFYQSMQINCDTCTFQEINDSISLIFSEWKIITIKNDSVINYYKKYYGLGSSTDIKYKLIDNVIELDTVDLYGRNVAPLEIGNLEFYKDSLIDLKTGIKYYSGKIQKFTTITLAGKKPRKVVYD